MPINHKAYKTFCSSFTHNAKELFRDITSSSGVTSTPQPKPLPSSEDENDKNIHGGSHTINQVS
jgi:hypothetical protein